MSSILKIGFMLTFFIQVGFSAEIVDKQNAMIRLSGAEAQAMQEIILRDSVQVTADSYVLSVTTSYQDFDFNRRTSKTGYVSCFKDASECTVKGTEIRLKGDGWFSPSKGFARVFGLGKLARLDKQNVFNCEQIYENIACDFRLDN